MEDRRFLNCFCFKADLAQRRLASVHLGILGSAKKKNLNIIKKGSWPVKKQKTKKYIKNPNTD